MVNLVKQKAKDLGISKILDEIIKKQKKKSLKWVILRDKEREEKRKSTMDSPKYIYIWLISFFFFFLN